MAVGLLLLLRADAGYGAPRAWSSSSRDDDATKADEVITDTASGRGRRLHSSPRRHGMTNADDVITDTESGRVRGHRHHAPYLRRAVDAYLGIPFAKPPLNSLRFRHPQAIEKWRHVYNATRLPNSCYQLHDTTFGTDFHVIHRR